MAWNPWRGMGDLPRDVWMLSFVTFINRAGLMALPFLVLYLTKNLGYSATSAGLMLTLYGL
ncbi:MFS transporter, partial [Cytophagia bacterium CHB2]|nr:MFS transporter [Cytophagia bacterium CHB2]